MILTGKNSARHKKVTAKNRKKKSSFLMIFSMSVVNLIGLFLLKIKIGITTFCFIIKLNKQ